MDLRYILLSINELLCFFKNTYESLGEKNKESQQHMARTKEIIDKLNSLDKVEKDKTKVMSQWATYLRKWLMYVACWRFSKSYNDILQGQFDYDLNYDNNHSLTERLLKKAMSEFVFDSRIITETEISAQIILDFLLDKFVPAVV